MTNMENQIVEVVTTILINGVKELSKNSYNNPVLKIVEKVVENNQAKFYEYFDKVFEETFENKDFRKLVKDEMSKKLVRGILCGSEGSVDKVMSKLKQNDVFKAKLTIAVDNVVSEFINVKE